jgi:DNA-binding SARP family transcriptional activator
VIAEKDRKSLLLKAGAIYEKKGDLEQSIRHYLKAKDLTCAANVMQHAGMKLLKMGRMGDLTHWLQALPEDTVKDNPWLLFFLCMTRRFKGVQENLNTLPMALESFRKRKEMPGVLFCLAALLEAIIAAGLPWKYLKKALDEAEPLLDSTNLDSYPYEKALLFSQFGYGHALRGNLHEGILALQQCFLLSSNLGDPILQADCLSHCIVAFTMSGEYFSANEYSKKLEKVAADCPLPELQTLHLLANSILCSFKGEVKRAKKLIELALEKIESHGLIYYYPVALMYKVFYCAFSEIYSEMESVGNQLVDMASSMGNDVLAASTTFFLGLNAYRQGNYEKAKKLIDKSHDICSPKNTNTQMQWYASKIVRVLISLRLKGGSGTENDLLEALGFFTRVNNRRFLAEIHLSMALLKWQQSRKDEVIGHLNTGFGLAEEVQHDHFLIMNGKDRVRACTLAVELNASKALSYAEHLLISKFASLSKQELKRLEKRKDRRIRRKAKEIKLAISREYAPQLRIETLGGFNVFKDGFPLNEKDWTGSQPKNLLKAIVAVGQEKRVHKEVLIDALWPDSKAEAAEKTFKTALHRLRKAIEPVMKNSPGFLYVHLKEKKVYLDSELCTVDAWEFLSLVKEGQELQNKGNNEAAISAYRKAIGLYKGTFLPRDLYASWADSKRHELKQQYVDLLLTSAKIEETRGSLTKAITLYEKAIREDPYLELTYQRLMTLYFDRGKRNEALKVYEKCKKAMREGLDTKPDPVTKAIHKKISA